MEACNNTKNKMETLISTFSVSENVIKRFKFKDKDFKLYHKNGRVAIHYEEDNDNNTETYYNEDGNIILTLENGIRYSKNEYDYEGEKIVYELEDFKYISHIVTRVGSCLYYKNGNIAINYYIDESLRIVEDYFDENGNSFLIIYPIKGLNLRHNHHYSRWVKREYDKNNNITLYYDSSGVWMKITYDTQGNEKSYEDSFGDMRGV